MSDTKNTKKKQMIFLGALMSTVFIAVGIGLLMTENKAPQDDTDTLDESRLTGITDDENIDSKHVVSEKDRWIERSEETMADLESENKSLKQSLETIKKQIEDLKSAKSEEKIRDEQINTKSTQVDFRDSPIYKNMGALGQPKTAVEIPTDPPRRDEVVANGSIGLPQQTGPIVENKTNDNEVFRITLKSEEKKTDESATRRHINRFVPAGSFAKAVLMSGVDAPTGGIAQSNPMPILLKIKGRGKLPNFKESKIKECHILGAAYGDIASERAMIRLETLSCVLIEGDIIEVPVMGYVAGEDGKNGLRGRLVSKQGSMIAKSAMAGIMSGFGASIYGQYTQLSQTPVGPMPSIDPKRAGEAGLAQGTKNSLDKLSDWYLARANETYPIIEVDAGRIGEIVITKGVDLGKIIDGNIQEFE